jgi:hypothetical protein
MNTVLATAAYEDGTLTLTREEWTQPSYGRGRSQSGMASRVEWIVTRTRAGVDERGRPLPPVRLVSGRKKDALRDFESLCRQYGAK